MIEFALFLILFCSAILVPLVPAIYMYRFFPDDKIKINGKVLGMTINATGAFAGYVTICLFAYYTGILQEAIHHIQDNRAVQFTNNSNWNVKANLKLTRYINDSTWAPIRGFEADTNLKNLKASFTPSLAYWEDDQLEIILPQAFVEQAALDLSIKGFQPVHIPKKRFKEACRNALFGDIVSIGDIEIRQLVPNPKPYTGHDSLPNNLALPGLPPANLVRSNVTLPDSTTTH